MEKFVWLIERYFFSVSGNWCRFFIAISVLPFMQMGNTSNTLFCGQPTLMTGEHFPSDVSAQVTDLWCDTELHTAGSLSTDGQMLTPYCHHCHHDHDSAYNPSTWETQSIPQRNARHGHCYGIHTYIWQRDSWHHALYIWRRGSSHSTVWWAF